MKAGHLASMRQCLGWHGWRWIAVACIIGLIVATVGIREAEHASQVQHLARGFLASMTSRGPPSAVLAVRPEAREGRTPAEKQLWMALHGMFVQEIEGIRARGEGLDLVFYGDSITESLRGTQMGIPIDKFKGIPEVAAQHFSHLNWAAFSLAGDTTLNLLWRLQNGEGPAASSPKVAVVLIGTNDLTNPTYNLDIQDPAGTSAVVAAGVLASVALLLRESAAHVLLMAVMPRGERFLFATAAEKYRQPSRYAPVIDAINGRLSGYADAQERVTYVDCNAVLLESGGGGGSSVEEEGGEGLMLNKELIPDALHPNALGQDRVFTCLEPYLAPYVPIKTTPM